jgi:hypothetical protein
LSAANTGSTRGSRSKWSQRSPGTVEQQDFVLDEQRVLGGFAQREVANRKHVRQDRGRHHAGDAVALQTIAQLGSVGSQPLAAPGHAVFDAAGLEGLPSCELDAGQILIEAEAALARHRRTRSAGGDRRAILLRILGGGGLLHVGVRAQTIERTDVVQRPLEAATVPLAAVFALEALGDDGAGSRRASAQSAEYFGVGTSARAFERGSEDTCGAGVEHALEQQRVVDIFLRVVSRTRAVARVHVTRVVGFRPLAMGVVNQS